MVTESFSCFLVRAIYHVTQPVQVVGITRCGWFKRCSVVALIRCTLQPHLIWKHILYEFKLDPNATE